MARGTVVEQHTVVSKKYTLVLTQEEAETLAVVVALVGGDMEDSPRKHTDAIAKVLLELGIVYRNTAAYRTEPYGTTQFKAYPKPDRDEW